MSPIRLSRLFVFTAMPILLWACSQPPAFTGVDPTETLPGAEVRIVGERFSDQLTVRLESPAGSPPVKVALLVSARSVATLTVAVPAETAPGTYDLVLQDPNFEVRIPGALVVRAPVVDAPCGDLYTANTTVSNVTGEVVVDRFYKDGQRETLRVKLADIQGIEIEKVPLSEGRTCSVVWMRKEDGERFRFADDAAIDLTSRGYKLGQEIGKPVGEVGAPAVAGP